MTQPWPPWATLRAEEVRTTLPPEQWGPWNNRGPCLLSNNTTGSNQMPPHPTEVPHFFYCQAHLQAIRERNTTVRPWPARDKGRCTSCGAPAARRPVTMADPVACVQAERTNSTVARLSTKRHCDRCNPNRRRLCPRPDVPKGHGEALGPIGRMLQHHQDQPASPLCRMLRRRRRQSVCSGHAAHHHRSRHRREKKK